MNISSSLSAAKNVVTSKLGRQVLLGQKHSPTLLFGAGVVGVVTTTVLASKATLKLEGVLSDHQANVRDSALALESPTLNYSEKDFKHDQTLLKLHLVRDVAKLYAPAIAVGVLSVSCLTGSHVILTRRNTAVMAAYKTLEKGFEDYRERVTKELGEDRERELRYGYEDREVAVDGKNGTEIKTIRTVGPEGPSIYARFFDEFNEKWKPRADYNAVFLRCQQNYANDMLRMRGHVFLNEVYDMLGFERTKAGACVGWVMGGKGNNYIDFGVFDGNSPAIRDFVNGREAAVLVDFNVDGVILDLI